MRGRYEIYYSTKDEIKVYSDYLVRQNELKKNKKEAEKIGLSVNINYRDLVVPNKPMKIITTNIDSDKKINKLHKYQIDCFTSRFKDEEDLKFAIDNNSEYNRGKITLANKNGRANKILVAYKLDGKFKYLDVIYNNLLLQKASGQLLIRNDGSSKIDYSNEELRGIFNNYFGKVLNYLKNPEYNKRLSNIFAKDEKYDSLHKRIRVAIEEYPRYLKSVETGTNIDDQYKEVYDEVKHYEKELAICMREYDILREIIVWEQKITKSLTQEKKENKNETMEGQLEISLDDNSSSLEDEIKKEIREDIEQVAIQGGKEALLRKFSLRDLSIMPKVFLEQYKIDIDKLKRKDDKNSLEILKQYENDKIYTYYNQGGPSNVIESMDLDELVRYPKVVLDSVHINLDGFGIDNGDSINNGKLK